MRGNAMFDPARFLPRRRPPRASARRTGSLPVYVEDWSGIWKFTESEFEQFLTACLAGRTEYKAFAQHLSRKPPCLVRSDNGHGLWACDPDVRFFKFIDFDDRDIPVLLKHFRQMKDINDWPPEARFYDDEDAR